MLGDPVLNNLKSLFEHLRETGHEMIINKWTDRDVFLSLCASMDIGLQCSFNETFNIVCADLLS